MSLEIAEILTPPSAVSCGAFGRIKKENNEFPPEVWAQTGRDVIIHKRKEKINVRIRFCNLI
jgi:hypothetical protein